MNFYTLTYDANLPTKQQINVPTNTDYKVGVKVVKDGELVALKSSDVTLGTLSADTELEDGYVTFTKAAGDNASYTKLDLDVDYKPLALSARSTPAKSVSKASIELSANPSLVGKVVKANGFWFRKAIGSGTTATSADVVAALD